MYSPILGCLGFILSKDRQKTLLVHRINRNNDDHLGKYNGLGGKMKEDEDIVGCLKREIQEEAGINCEEITMRGTVSWPNFGPNGEDWLGFIFTITAYSGVPKSENEEGPLSWHSISELANLPMWPGDRHFLPMVFDNDPRQFHGHMPYKNGKPTSWHYSRI